MVAGNHQPAPAAGAGAMLGLWEAAADGSDVGRALALLSAAHADMPAEALAALPIGRRDADLLDLHDRLFGSRIDCKTECAACGATMEVTFDTADVRTMAAAVTTRITLKSAGIDVIARLPDSHDLAAIERVEDAEAAWQILVRRCILEARRGAEPIPATGLPRTVLEAIETAVAETDPQADVVISLACPDCGAEALVPFDIARQTWARLDHWARAMLGAVDAIARRYGWNEADILALGPRRRQHYLDLIGGGPQ